MDKKRPLILTQQLSPGSKFIALMDELFTNTLSPLALFPFFGKLLVKNQIKRRYFILLTIRVMDFIVVARFEMFSEIRELFEAVIEEHEESLDESDPRQEFKIIISL